MDMDYIGPKWLETFCGSSHARFASGYDFDAFIVRLERRKVNQDAAVEARVQLASLALRQKRVKKKLRKYILEDVMSDKFDSVWQVASMVVKVLYTNGMTYYEAWIKVNETVEDAVMNNSTEDKSLSSLRKRLTESDPDIRWWLKPYTEEDVRVALSGAE